MKSAIIFDLDGTIIDSMDEFSDIASAVINKCYGTELSEARKQYFQTSGLPFFEQIEVLHPGDERNAGAAEEYESTKKKTYLSKKAYPDAVDALEYLRSKRIKTVVSSNNFQGLVSDLTDKLGLKFDLVLGWRENFAKGKDHFKFVQEKFACRPDEMIFVGDSLKDSDKARDFGIDFIAKTGTFSRKDFEDYGGKAITIINTLSDLQNIF